jgi:hypothetical protein
MKLSIVHHHVADTVRPQDLSRLISLPGVSYLEKLNLPRVSGAHITSYSTSHEEKNQSKEKGALILTKYNKKQICKSRVVHENGKFGIA